MIASVRGPLRLGTRGRAQQSRGWQRLTWHGAAPQHFSQGNVLKKTIFELIAGELLKAADVVPGGEVQRKFSGSGQAMHQFRRAALRPRCPMPPARGGPPRAACKSEGLCREPPRHIVAPVVTLTRTRPLGRSTPAEFNGTNCGRYTCSMRHDTYVAGQCDGSTEADTQCGVRSRAFLGLAPISTT